MSGPCNRTDLLPACYRPDLSAHYHRTELLSAYCHKTELLPALCNNTELLSSHCYKKRGLVSTLPQTKSPVSALQNKTDFLSAFCNSTELLLVHYHKKELRSAHCYKTKPLSAHCHRTELLLTHHLRKELRQNTTKVYKVNVDDVEKKIHVDESRIYEGESISNQPNLFLVEIYLFFFDEIALLCDALILTVFKCHQPRTEKVRVLSFDPFFSCCHDFFVRPEMTSTDILFKFGNKKKSLGARSDE